MALTDFLDILKIEGFYWLVIAVFFAAVVRGFTGFGSALVYLPVAAQFLPPAVVIASMAVFGLMGPLPLMPRAIRDCAPAEVFRLSLAAFIGIPVGVYLLTQLDPKAFRWMVSAVAFITLVTLASGWRYRRAVSKFLTAITGFTGGLMAGFLGLAGPPVILLYLGGQKKVAEIRAVILLYLFATDIAVVTVFLIQGLITIDAALVGVMLIPSYVLGGLIGQRIFNPEHEKLFRYTAYSIITLALVTGLPIFD